MADLTELVAQLSELDADEVAKAMQDSAHAQWQKIYNLGHSAATKELRTKLEQKDAELEAERKAKAKTEASVKELQEKQPDTKAIREQYEAQITELNTKHEADLKAEKAERANVEVRRALSDLESQMIAAGINPVYARVAAKDLADRFKYEDGELQILQKGKDIPITPGEGKTAIGLLVEEARKDTPAEFVVSKAEPGSGTKGNGAASGGSARWDQYRLSAEEKSAGSKDLAAELDRRTGRATG